MAMRAISEGDKVLIIYTDESSQTAIVLHRACDTGDLWYFVSDKNHDDIFGLNPCASTLERIDLLVKGYRSHCSLEEEFAEVLG